jgi:hypothetical protein
MIRLVERETGAQVWPVVEEQAKLNGWLAHLASDADLRAKAPEYRGIAEDLVADVR